MGSLAQQQYLAKVLPWPVDGEAGYVNIHWTWTPSDHETGKPYPWGGRACRSVDEAINVINYQSKKSGTRDIYACQSRQLVYKEEKIGRNNYHYFIAERSKVNTAYLKSLFLDVDLKDYDSDEDLRRHLAQFLVSTGLPKPSCMVFTTGGYHIYWTFSEPLTPDRWYPLAHALVEATKQKDLPCDTQCTVDSVRVLRIPDTLNHKRNQWVKLVYANPDDYSVERIERALLPFKVNSSSKLHHVNGSKLDPSIFPKQETTEPISDDLGAGILEQEYPLLKMEELTGVLKECEFLRETAKTGGINNRNPAWNLTTLIATFFENGEQLAHGFGYKHASYSREETSEFFARKLKEQQELKLGWPACHTINNNGSMFCRACPHFSKGKTPLHLRGAPDEPETNNVPPPGSAPPGVKSTNVLPPGYIRDARGYIQKKIQGVDGTITYNTICDVAMGDAWLQRDPWRLNFAAEAVPGKPEQINMAFELIGAAAELRKELSRQGITIYDRNVKPVGEFLLSWIHVLKQTKDAVVSTAPFGWNVNNGKLEGFVFGGKLFTPNEVRVAQNPDVITSKGFIPVGDIQPWIDASRLITNQKRPALNAILASSFAAPLVRFTNMEGLMMSCIGESGIGKSTALDVALSVWGHPVRAKNTVSDTDNFVMNRVGELRNLPIYWDDLQPDTTPKYCRMTFQMSYGSEKKRLGPNAKPKDAGMWQTIMISTSNSSLLDYVVMHTPTTTAGIYRLFEIPVVSGKGYPGQIAKVDAAHMMGKLKDNHGIVGEQYAEYLGKNFLTLEGDVLEYQRELDIEVDAQQPERLWTSTIAAICMGAKVANELGFTEIDEPELRAFMLEQLINMRGELKNHAVDMTQEINVSAILSNFLNAQRARNTLITNLIHKGKGKPLKGSIEVKGDMSKLEAIHVHLGLEDKLLRINSNALTEWLNMKGLSRHAFTSALKEKFGMKVVHGNIGGGTPFSVSGLTYMLEMSLLDFTDDIKMDDLVKDPVFEEAPPPA